MQNDEKRCKGQTFGNSNILMDEEMENVSEGEGYQDLERPGESLKKRWTGTVSLSQHYRQSGHMRPEKTLLV